MKIRTAIFGVYVAASAAGFAVLMMFVLKEVRPRYVESMRGTLGDTAGVLAVMLEGDLARQPDADLATVWKSNGSALEKASGALRVYVTDAKGTVVFGTAKIPDASVAEVRMTAPVKAGAEVVGFVGVARPLSAVTAAIWHARVRLMAGGIAVAIFMMAAGWWIASKLTHSLERLTEYALAVRDGKAARPPQSRASEVAALAKAFEEMRVALEGKAYVERYTQALAHELKAPLSAIRGAAELLQESMPAEERTKFLAHLRVESARIQQIVDRMLQLAALEARRGRLGENVVDLRAVVAEVCTSARVAAEARCVGLNYLESDAPVTVCGEAVLLAQAVSNLVQNALEFSLAGGAVVVRVAEAGGCVRVTVEDAGPGVPNYAVERIFERFYSLPRPVTGRKSTGLGLSIVREVARLHGGEARVANRPGGGACAELVLPLA